MIFDKLVIRNFRSFDEKGAELKFDSAINLYSLIGPNSSGKSNVLDALSLVLENYRSEWREEKIKKSDFYQEKLFDEEGDPITLSITLYLQEGVAFVETPTHYGGTKPTHLPICAICFSAKVAEKGDNEADIRCQNVCLFRNDKGNCEKEIWQPTKLWSKPNIEIPEGAIIIEKDPQRVGASDLIKLLPKSYFLNIEGLKGFLKLTGFAPLARIIDSYKKDLKINTDQVDLPKSDVLTAKNGKRYREVISELRDKALNQWSREFVGFLKTKLLGEIESKLSEKTNQYLGLEKNALGIQFGTVDVEEIIDRIIEVKIKDKSGVFLPLDKQGSGYLSLFRLAILEILLELRELPPAILLIEEPELYLHPSLQRHLFAVLKKLSQRGYQIFFATHSPEFTSLENYKSIIRLNKGIATDIQRVEEKDLDFSKGISKFERRLREKGNKEIFFANKVLLLEGKDDFVTLKLLFEKYERILDDKNSKINSDLANLVFVDCGSKNDIPNYVRLCYGLGINFFIVHDTDLDDTGKQKAETKKFVEDLKGVLTGKGLKYEDCVFVFPDKLEKSMGLTSKDDSKIIALLEPKTYKQVCKDHPDLKLAMDKILKQLKL